MSRQGSMEFAAFMQNFIVAKYKEILRVQGFAV